MIMDFQAIREDFEQRQIVRCKQSDALIDLAIELFQNAEKCDAAGSLECGTGADVPYACAAVYRELARKIERIAFI